MNIQTKYWGKALNGENVYLFTWKNAKGCSVSVSNYGASWISAIFPDSAGKLDELVLGYTNLKDYLRDKNYLGSTIGRVANRIRKSSFIIDYQQYVLEPNDGENTNHGGWSGFHSKVWGYEILPSEIKFSLFSKDKEGGYPGNLNVSVSYIFNDNDELSIKFSGISDKLTYLNLTNHAYFNLGGRGNILDHSLKINADYFLKTDKSFIPEKDYSPVQNSAFDFNNFQTIGQRMTLKDRQLLNSNGYNHYFKIKKDSGEDELFPMAFLTDTSTGRKLEVHSSYPGLVLYTGNYLDSSKKSRFKSPLSKYEGVCLEAQFPPDDPNLEMGKKSLLKPGIEYNHITQYIFKY